MPWQLLTKFPESVGIPLSGGRIIVEKNLIKNRAEGDLVYKGKNVFWGYSNSYRDLGKKMKLTIL